MTSRWELASTIWSLAKRGGVANDALIALIKLRLIDRKVMKGDVAPLIYKLKRIDDEIDVLLKETNSLSLIFNDTIPISKVASPMLRGFLNKYGIANADDAKRKLYELKHRLDKVIKGEFTDSDIDDLRKFLEALSMVAIEQIGRLSYIESRGSPWEEV